MRGAPPLETLVPTVEMVPFPPVEPLPSLPPAPGEQPVAPNRARAARIGEGIGAVGAALLLASLFVGGWHHVDRIEVTLGDRPFDDSYVGDSLRAYANNYSLAVWAFLKRGYAIPLIAVAVTAAAASLLVVGARRRGLVALALPFALATFALCIADLRQLPATITEMATHFPAFPSAVHVRGVRPGPMMLLGFGGLLLQIGGALLAIICLPRVRRAPRRPLRSRTERKAEGEEQPIDELQLRGAGEYAVQSAAPLPAQTADQGWREGQGEQREQHPR